MDTLKWGKELANEKNPEKRKELITKIHNNQLEIYNKQLENAQKTGNVEQQKYWESRIKQENKNYEKACPTNENKNEKEKEKEKGVIGTFTDAFDKSKQTVNKNNEPKVQNVTQQNKGNSSIVMQ